MSNEKKNDTESEVKVFAKIGEEYTLSSGNKITIQPLPWGKEIFVCQLVSKFFTENNMIEIFNNLSSVDNESDDAGFDAMVRLITPLIQEAPQTITQIVAILTSKPEKEIEETLTADDVMGVFVPFLRSLFSKYAVIFQQASQTLVK
jgi:hypothetical protein|tara:strand:+ start:266 stop:706 length:441 start_codon:yes stop_codon:yes gene_type:complete